MDTENKQDWCASAIPQENAFAINRLFDLGLSGNINLSKKTDVYTHDLFISFPSDLKSVQTPLFKAKELFGIDPQYAVTFNKKDAVRYRNLYPNIIVVFDINWKETQADLGGTIYRVNPMHMTVAGFLSDIRRAIVKSGTKTIEYRRRVDDQSGNAKESWVFDSRDLHLLNLKDLA
jgi:hypothetical protein